jgi:hypothetical protein
MKEVVESWVQLGEATKRIGFQVKEVTRQRKPGGEWQDTRIEECQYFMANGEGKFFFDRREWKDGAWVPYLPRTVHVVNRSYEAIFTAGKESGWLIQSVEMPNTGTTERGIYKPSNFERRLPWLAPGGAGDLFHLVVSRQTRFTSVEQGPKDSFIRVAFERARTPGPTKFGIELSEDEERRLNSAQSGYFDIDTTKHNVITGAKLNRRGRYGDYSLLLSLEYEANTPVPVVKRSVCDIPALGRPDGTKVHQVHESEFSPFDADPATFWLSYYGLPEPVGVTPPARRTPLYVWLFISAAILLAVAIGCRYVRRRMRARSSGTAPPVEA